MQNYIDLLKDIKENGVHKPSRAGDTLSVFGRQLRWNMKDGFPLMTIKKISFHNVAHELLWFLGAFDEKWKKFGNTNIKYLVDHNVNIWNDDAYRGYLNYLDHYYNTYNEPELDWMKDDPHQNKLRPFTKKEFVELIKENDEVALALGELGETYGSQWRRWSSCCSLLCSKHQPIDQIQQVIDQLKENPLSRRHIVTAWKPEVVDSLVLAPCHYGFTFNVEPINPRRRLQYAKEKLNLFPPKDSHSSEFWDKWCDENKVPKYKLNLMWRQRSVDSPIGLPYNIVSYRLMLHIIAYLTNMIPNDLICSLEDTHIYLNQMDAVDELLSREGTEPDLPTLELVNLDRIKTIDDFRLDNFKINDYNSLSAIKAPLSVGL